jgi:hypothetical protein
MARGPGTIHASVWSVRVCLGRLGHNPESATFRIVIEFRFTVFPPFPIHTSFGRTQHTYVRLVHTRARDTDTHKAQTQPPYPMQRVGLP